MAIDNQSPSSDTSNELGREKGGKHVNNTADVRGFSWSELLNTAWRFHLAEDFARIQHDYIDTGKLMENDLEDVDPCSCSILAITKSVAQFLP